MFRAIYGRDQPTGRQKPGLYTAQTLPCTVGAHHVEAQLHTCHCTWTGFRKIVPLAIFPGRLPPFGDHPTIITPPGSLFLQRPRKEMINFFLGFDVSSSPIRMPGSVASRSRASNGPCPRSVDDPRLGHPAPGKDDFYLSPHLPNA